MSYFTQYVTAGEIVLDGTDFRNVAHLRFKADILVPCGGRYVFSRCIHSRDVSLTFHFQTRSCEHLECCCSR